MLRLQAETDALEEVRARAGAGSAKAREQTAELRRTHVKLGKLQGKMEEDVSRRGGGGAQRKIEEAVNRGVGGLCVR